METNKPTRMKSVIERLLVVVCILSIQIIWGQETAKIYLSGKDFKHPVKWEFMCTDGANNETQSDKSK